MSEPDLITQLHEAKLEIEELRLRLSRLELHAQRVALPVALPHTMLLDESFLKRAFAVLGHYAVASLIIGVPFYVLIFIIAFLVAGL